VQPAAPYKNSYMLSTDNDYRQVLREELESRCRKNHRYSLRSFARDLGITSSRLSEVMRGRYGLSRGAATEIAQKLGWSANEVSLFGDLVDSQHARTKRKRAAAQGRLVSYQSEYRQLTSDAFQVIADWYHYAILELVCTPGFRNDDAWIAKSLGISEHLVAGGIARLKRIGLLAEKNGALQAMEDFTASPSGVPSSALRKFHSQLLKKAHASLYLQHVDDRDISHVVLAVDRRRIAEAKEEIKKFRRGFDAKFGQGEGRDLVYCLGMTFFSLQEKNA